MTSSADYLRVRSPTTTPKISKQVELVEKRTGQGWFYRAEFDELPEAIEACDGEYSDLAVEGKIEDIFFHLTAPSMICSSGSTDEQTVEIDIHPSSNGYERFGTLEYRNGSWTELATKNIADPSDARRAGVHGEQPVDTDRVARTRAANCWVPSSQIEESNYSPRDDITDLICILPEQVPDERIAELASNHLEVSKTLIEDSIPGIRAKLRSGDLWGPEVFQRDGSVYCYTPDWATPCGGGYHD